MNMIPGLRQRIVEQFGGGVFLRTALLASFAAVAGFGIGNLYSEITGIVAAITALVSIRPTFHDSVKESLIQIVGTLIGAVVALVLTQIFGASLIILFLALLCAYATARLLRLGEEGAVTIAITMVLVTGGNMTTVAVEYRFLGVIVGVLTATLMSLYTSKGTPTSRALQASLLVSDRIADLLAEISDGLQVRAVGKRVPSATIEGWLDRAQTMQRELSDAYEQASGAVAGARYSPLFRREEARQVLAQVTLAQMTCESVIGICRDLLAISQNTEPLPAPFALSISEVLTSLADVVSGQAEVARSNPAKPLVLSGSPASNVRLAANDATAHLKDIEDTMPLIIGGSILQDSDKITRALTQKDPA